MINRQPGVFRLTKADNRKGVLSSLVLMGNISSNFISFSNSSPHMENSHFLPLPQNY